MSEQPDSTTYFLTSAIARDFAGGEWHPLPEFNGAIEESSAELAFVDLIKTFNHGALKTACEEAFKPGQLPAWTEINVIVVDMNDPAVGCISKTLLLS